MQVRARERLLLGWTVAVVAGAAAAFLVPALEKTGGAWPAPLDDVFIHFDFARSAARGHPFSWVVGNGYSSGATSPLYPLVLAVGWAVGFRGASLGVFATLVAALSLVDFARSLQRLQVPLVRFLAPIVIVAVPLLDWTWFSGMEVAFASVFLGRALRAAREAETLPPRARRKAQLRAGIYLAALALSRPECVVLAPLLGVSIAARGGALPAAGSLCRGVGPTVLALGLFTALNLTLTGEAEAAGAVRKLITSSPYASRADIAALVLKNFAELLTGGIDIPLGGAVGSLIVKALALVACVDRRARALAVPLLLGAVGALLLACLNTTAPFQNMRYATPSLVLMLVAALLGVDALARWGRAGGVLGGVAMALFIVSAARAFPRQIDHFARASRNIAEQQVAVGRRIRAGDRPRRVFVGDAGAIPYFADAPALDGLGLGGYHGLPFARASVHGVPAVIELIERMPPEERPDMLAIYDSWWPGVGASFGEPLYEVTIADNVICGDAKKSVYRADWSLLEDRAGPWLDRLDIGDIVDEQEHAYEMPKPHGGSMISAILRDAHGDRRYDAGRVIPEGLPERFVVRGAFARGTHTLVVRTDDPEARTIRIERQGLPPLMALLQPAAGSWSETSVSLDAVGPGDAIAVRGEDGALRSFAYMLE